MGTQCKRFMSFRRLFPKMDLRKLQRAATMMMFSVFHAGMYHMNLMMFYMLKERYRQIVNNRRLMIISKRFFYLKKLFIKRQKRTCWIKAGRTSAWWKKFQENEVPASEWKDKFRMTKQSFHELCEIVHPHLVKKTTRFRVPVSADTQVAIFLYYISDEGR